ncbi:LysE family translocator [Rhizobium sp. LjRoot254]|uniref:LysE family translocator n=1 Tax=Rhizobium sp. LjRoot254 TaxID=3342297 RepID=UPI003ED0F1BA
MEFLPDLTTLVAFTVATLLLAITPGPDMTISISRALTDGRLGGAMVVLGTSTGVVVHTLLVAFGVSALIVASPTAFLVLKTGGAAYLVWLAIQAIRHGSSLSVKRAEGPVNSGMANYLSGFWINLLNPKVIIFFMTFLPQFVSASDPHVTGKLIFLGLWFIIWGMPVNFAVVLTAEALSSWLQRNRKVLRGIDYTFAGVFSLFAVKIFMTQAR